MNKIYTLIFSLLFLILVHSCKKEGDYDNLDCTSIAATFSANVKPIINANCLGSGCHDAGSVNGDLTTYAGVKSKVRNGTFERQVLTDKTMPQLSALSLSDRQKLKCWLNSGSLDN